MNDQNDPNQPGTQTPPPTIPTPSFSQPTEPASIPPAPAAATPTFPQTTAELPPIQQGTTTPPPGNLSPLDNPWGVPIQPPPIDSGGTLQAVPQTIASESAPTDLSHLIGNSQPEENSPQQSTLETLVAPPINTVPDVPTTPQVEHKGIPKWLIGVGIGLFLLVVGASAYFILGIGQAPDTTSIPATQAPKTTQQIKPPALLPTPVSQPAATGSASFDQLQGGSAGGQATSSGSTTIDTLRQRQQQRQ